MERKANAKLFYITLYNSSGLIKIQYLKSKGFCNRKLALILLEDIADTD
jgi:hypothetical protein